jgi:lysophospholipase L1-like esterase
MNYFEAIGKEVGDNLRNGTEIPVYDSETIRARLQREANPWDIFFDVLARWGGSGASGGNVFLTTFTRTCVNKGYYAESFCITTSKLCKVRTTGLSLVDAVTGLARIGSSEDQFNDFTLAPGVPLTLVCNQLFTPDRKSPSLYLISVIDQDPRYPIPVVSGGGVTLWTINKNGGLTGNNTNIGNGFYTYTINLTNSSAGASSGMITITDQIPVDARYVLGSGTGWTISESGGVLTATTSSVIAAGAAANVVTITLAPKTNVQLSMSLKGHQCDIDINYNAKPLVFCGTSITYGTGPTSYNSSYSYLFRNWLRDVRQKTYRVVNRAIPGSTSTHHENLRAFTNRYDLGEQPEVVVYEHGVNDAATSIPTATSVANLLAFIAHWRRISPDIWVIAVAPTPLQVVGWEAGCVAVNTAYINALTTLNDPKVTYVAATRTLWNPVTESGVNTTDGTHPNDVGNGKIYSAITNHIINNNIPI